MTITDQPMTITCPTWCTSTDHDEIAPLPERWHSSDSVCVDVMSEPPYRDADDNWRDSYLVLSLSHTFAHRAATIDLVVTNKDGTDRAIRLSADEATAFAEALLRLAAVEREAAQR